MRIDRRLVRKLAIPILFAAVSMPLASAAVVERSIPNRRVRPVPSPGRQPPPTAHAAPVNCFNDAKLRTFLDDDQSTRLCRCQHSSKNVECFVQAKQRTFLDDEEAMRLCAGTEYADLNCVDY